MIGDLAGSCGGFPKTVSHVCRDIWGVLGVLSVGVMGFLGRDLGYLLVDVFRGA